MAEFDNGDRVRVDNGAEYHGRHGSVVALGRGGRLEIEFPDGSAGTFGKGDLRPVPNTDTSLSRRERDTLTNIWGAAIPDDLRKIDDDELLWEMRHQVSEAVDQCYLDDDMDALGILFPIEYKITEILAERQSTP